MDVSFWKGKRVFLTGHTGFKGSWLSRILVNAGAELTGYSLQPSATPNLFDLCGIESQMTSVVGDIRDREHLLTAFKEAKPEIAIHMAAQPIVRESYKDPAYTYETNVMGTINILECMRLCGGVRSFLNVTTDKVYHNNEWHWGYRETDALDGFDPYSNSKSCSELVTHSYKNAFFADGCTAVSTARAGNVIGGGDFSVDRIVPDCVRAAEKKLPIIVRNPHSIRPYQHVLDPIAAYLMIAQKQYEDNGFADCYNVGPDDSGCVTTGRLVELFCRSWGDNLQWETQSDGGPHEASFLKLDCSKLKSVLEWKPVWGIETAVRKTVEWTRAYLDGEDVCAVMDRQFDEFMKSGE